MMGVFVIDTWAYWLLVSGLFVSTAASFAETWIKRRESAALKENAELRDTALRRESWLRKAKSQAGYDNSVSFDVVWAETLKKARLNETPNAIGQGRAACGASPAPTGYTAGD
jgi:hypothetical protein